MGQTLLLRVWTWALAKVKSLWGGSRRKDPIEEGGDVLAFLLEKCCRYWGQS